MQIVSVIVFSSVMIKKLRVTPERAAVPAARNVTVPLDHYSVDDTLTLSCGLCLKEKIILND